MRPRAGWAWFSVGAIALLALAPPQALGRGDTPRRPDLAVVSVSSPPQRAVPGDRFAARDVTVNLGRRRAAASETRYLLGTQAVASRSVPALRKGAASDGAVKIAIPRSMPDGAYRLTACADAAGRVRERDEDNNCRSSTVAIVVDTTAPARPRIDAHPDAATAHTSATFAFSSAEPDVQFACRVDAAPFAPCASPLALDGLAEGAHRLEVTARDPAGNESERAVFEWTVDVTPPPAPSIDERPAPVVLGGDVLLAFSDAEQDVRFECALDGALTDACSSPLKLSGLADGEHAFRIVARDAAGNESDPVSVHWIVVPEQMTLGDGAWSWFADPRAVHYQGAHRRTYVGWVARDGDVKVSAYDHDTLTKTTALVAPSVQVDDHANPAIQILPDGRVRAYFSPHTGTPMWYRTTLAPEDVSAWGPAVTMPENTAGSRGFTYPNPMRLAAEGRTYLFWRGGDYNPNFATQADGSDSWTPVRRLVSVPGARPYVKYDSDGESTIHIAFTNAHPAESTNVNIYYAAYRDGALRRADGTPIGTLGTPIVPSAADVVFDEPYDAWIHDVAHDAQGRPVLVFAAFPTDSDHRYLYARWTGQRWVTRPITAAGGSISEDLREPFYSGGITLDHEDPRTVYLSRQVGAAWEVETWTTPDGGDSWSVEAVTAGSDTKNVRPVSPRGMLPFSGDMNVLWMRGRYPYFLTYQTSIATILRTGGDAPPVADATTTPRTGLAPLAVAFDGRPSHDPEETALEHRWDFGDGATATGAQATHVYAHPGRYSAALTVTDGAGRRDIYVTEIVVRAGVVTGPALDLAGTAATLHGAVTPREQAATYHFDYGTDALDARTPDFAPDAGGGPAVDVQAPVRGLTPGLRYRYRLALDTALGTVYGAERVFTAGAPSGYRDVVLGTPGVLGYWRLGEAAGVFAADELGARPGAYAAKGVTLGQPGALRGDPNTSAAFDGSVGEVTAPTPALTTSGTLEGWFHWQAGVALMRDDTSTSGSGWILAYESGGMIACRAGGTPLVSSTAVTSVRDGWHHFALTRDGEHVRLYLDGERLALRGDSPGPASAAPPWHVMRNGTSPTQYTRGRADEVAVYDGPLTAADIRQRVALGPQP
jgi:PKD repeat protein